MADSTLTISFSTTTDDDSKFITLELDDDLNEEVNGTTSDFVFGSTVYFKMFTNCTTITFITTDNEVESGTDGTDSVEEYITFTQPSVALGGVQSDNTASLSKPVNSDSFSASLVGGNSGVITVEDSDPSTAIASQVGVGVYLASYDSDYTGKKIVGPTQPTGWTGIDSNGDSISFPLVIVVVGS